MIIFNTFIDKNQLNSAGNVKNLPLNTVVCIKLTTEEHTSFKELTIKSLNNFLSQKNRSTQDWAKDKNQFFGHSL